MAITDAPRVPGMVEDEPEDLYEEEGLRITRRGDSAVVDFAPGMSSTSKFDNSKHSANLAETLEQRELIDIAAKVVEQVDADLASRKNWQRRIDQAEELLGLNDTPLDDLPFDGASGVTYPLIGEACIQFQARAIEEIFPSDGPCKTKIVGKRTVEKEEQAYRVQHHMNYQMVDQDRAYFWHVDQMLLWLPLTGSAFKKTYYDPIQDMTISRMVKTGDFIVPYLANDLRTSPRYTHRIYLTEGELRRLIASGFYREVDILPETNAFQSSYQDDAKSLEDIADDREPSEHEDDNVYCLYEMHCDLMLDMDLKKYLGIKDGDGSDVRPLPYIVTVDRDSQEVMSIRRNWRESDTTLFEKRIWFTHYKYLPGLGFYGFGLLHLIGSLSESVTGTLRALLDSAAFANMQGGFVSDEAKLEQNYHIEPGIYKQVKMTADEMARAFYTPPFREPSTALSQLFGVLVDTGRRFASITEEAVGDAPNTGPVGTTLALIEQSQKVFSGVHRRLHVAQAEEFKLRAELNFEFLNDEYPYQVSGQDMMVLREDYDGRVDIVPVSDPNIFSNAQRIAQSQAVVEIAEKFPGKVDLDVALERFFKAIKIPDADELLLGKRQSMRRDPISENMLMMTGAPAKSFVEQDHDAHIQVHMSFMAGLNQEALEIIGPPMQAHLGEHYAFKYYNEMNQALGGQLPPPTWMDRNQKDDDEEIPIEADVMISQAAAQVPPIQLMPPDEEGPDAEQAEHEAEMQRKQQAFEAEEQRRQEAFEREQERKDMTIEYEADRKMAQALTEEERKEIQFERDQARKRREERTAAKSKKAGASK